MVKVSTNPLRHMKNKDVVIDRGERERVPRTPDRTDCFVHLDGEVKSDRCNSNDCIRISEWFKLYK